MEKENDKAFNHAVDNVVKSLLQEEDKGFNEDLEPWEVYCERKKHLMTKKTELFKKRFVNGYKELLTELKNGIGEP